MSRNKHLGSVKRDVGHPEGGKMLKHRMHCLECDWVGSQNNVGENGRCPRCKSDKVIITLTNNKKGTPK